MGMLSVRAVPDEVTAVLKHRAAAQGQSLSAYLRGELTRLASRPTHAEVIARIRAQDRSGGPTTEEIVAEIRAHRGD